MRVSSGQLRHWTDSETRSPNRLSLKCRNADLAVLPPTSPVHLHVTKWLRPAFPRSEFSTRFRSLDFTAVSQPVSRVKEELNVWVAVPRHSVLTVNRVIRWLSGSLRAADTIARLAPESYDCALAALVPVGPRWHCW